MPDEPEFDVDAELEARDYAIVQLTLACVRMERQVAEMAETIRELMTETSERVDVLVH